MNKKANTRLGGPNLDRLSAAALAAIAGLARLSDADRQAALKVLGAAQGRRVWAPRLLGALPTLTELVLDRDREAIYGSDCWAEHYLRSSTVIAYILQAPGLARLAAELDGVSLAKVGTSTPGTIDRRHADLRREAYGAWYRAARRYVCEPGFDTFEHAPRLQLARQHPLSPVRLCCRGIEVGLPEGLTPGEFEADLNRRLLPLRLQTFVDSEAGLDLCARTGTDPARLRRFYRVGSTRKAATEITLMRPQADVGALARMCANIVIDAVMGLRWRRPSR